MKAVINRKYNLIIHWYSSDVSKSSLTSKNSVYWVCIVYSVCVKVTCKKVLINVDLMKEFTLIDNAVSHGGIWMNFTRLLWGFLKLTWFESISMVQSFQEINLMIRHVVVIRQRNRIKFKESNLYQFAINQRTEQ